MSHIPLFTVLLSLAMTTACASVPYEFGGEVVEFSYDEDAQEHVPRSALITRGKPNWFVDGLGNIVGLPVKLLLFSWSVENHDISEDTEAAISAYMSANGLEDTAVRLNEYDPGGEWRRLVANKQVGAGWRYTVGLASLFFYTVLPQRVFGGDNFNPYTNTISLVSDHRSIALHEGGHAKDFAARHWKGTYGALRILPLFPLYQEALATGDAIGYEKHHENIEGEKAAYKVLYPAYGTYLGGEAVRWIPLSSTGLAYAIQYGAVLPMHIIGRTKAWLVDDPEQPQTPEDATQVALETEATE